MPSPLVSIITPSFNQGQFIEETLKSVASQTYRRYEHIIIDGGSTDETVKILKKYKAKYPDKIKWLSEKDKGQSDAINKGLKMAKGEIVGYLCSDDFYTKTTLEIIVHFFSKNPNAKIVTGDYFIIDERKRKMNSFIRIYKKIFWLFNSYNTLLFVNYINQPSTFWKKELIKKYGYFNIKFQYEFDYDWWLKVVKENKLYIINKPLSYFRLHSKSKSGSQYEKQFREDYQVVYNKISNKILLFLKKIHNELIILIYKFIRY